MKMSDQYTLEELCSHQVSNLGMASRAIRDSFQGWSETDQILKLLTKFGSREKGESENTVRGEATRKWNGGEKKVRTREREPC